MKLKKLKFIFLSSLLATAFNAITNGVKAEDNFNRVISTKNYEAILIEGLNLTSQSITSMTITDIPQNITHVKVKTSRKNLKSSNLKTSTKIRKVKVAQNGNRYIEIKFKTNKYSSIHNVELDLLQKINKRKYVTVGLEKTPVVVSGLESCPETIKPVCGFTRLNQYCEEGSEICLEVLSSEHLTYKNLCEMEKIGAEILHQGRCRIEGQFPNQPI